MQQRSNRVHIKPSGNEMGMMDVVYIGAPISSADSQQTWVQVNVFIRAFETIWALSANYPNLKMVLAFCFCDVYNIPHFLANSVSLWRHSIFPSSATCARYVETISKCCFWKPSKPVFQAYPYKATFFHSARTKLFISLSATCTRHKAKGISKYIN